MRPADLTGAALILQTAMRLASERGWDGVSMRDIAAAAGVSPSLVVHHYGTKGSLRAAVDQRTVEVFTELIDQFSEVGADDLGDHGEPLTVSITAGFQDRFGDGSPVVGYVRRLLFEGGEAAETLFGAVLGAVERMLDTLRAHGIAAPSDDPAVLAAFLLLNDLATMLLRDQVTRALGVDPLSRAGMQRWGRAVMGVYRDGIFAGQDRTFAQEDNREGG